MNDLKEVKNELNRLLFDIGIYYKVRELEPELLRRYLLDNYNVYLNIRPVSGERFKDEIIPGKKIGWQYDVLDLDDDINCISQDLQVYPTYESVLYNGLTESFAFISLLKRY